jgi:hypothetical protein
LRTLSYLLVVVAILATTLFIPARAHAQEGDVSFEGLKLVYGEDGTANLVWNLRWWEKPTINPGIGPAESSGSIAVNPDKTTTYVLTIEKYIMGNPMTVKWEATVIVEPKE